MKAFFGTFTNKIDAKGRVSRFETLLSGFTDSFVPAARDEAAELIMEELRELPLDGDGRIVLPDEFIAKARLKDQATFVGRGWKFQLWEPSSLAIVKQAKLRRVTASLSPTEGGTP